MTDVLLELDAIAPVRPAVTIKSKVYPDGKLYELVTVNDLSIEDQTELAQRGQRLETLIGEIKGAVPTTEAARELTLLLDAMIPKILLGLEPEVYDSLQDMQKLRIVEVFTEASPSPTSETEQGAATPTQIVPAPPTGDAQSPVSNASTAAT